MRNSILCATIALWAALSPAHAKNPATIDELSTRAEKMAGRLNDSVVDVLFFEKDQNYWIVITGNANYNDPRYGQKARYEYLKYYCANLYSSLWDSPHAPAKYGITDKKERISMWCSNPR